MPSAAPLPLIGSIGLTDTYENGFSKVELFNINDVFGGWANAYREHFGKGGLYRKMSKAKP